MNTFVHQALNSNKTFTENGAATLSTSSNAIVDLFYTIGASRGKDIIPLFQKAFDEDQELATRVALWARDIRQGAGERQLFRDILKFMEITNPEVAKKVTFKISELGRFDDLLVFETDELFNHSAKLIKENILEEVKKHSASTAAKWMPRKGKVATRLRKVWGLTPKQYRKFLVNSTKVVENQMCAKEWDKIDFETVPSLAMARYTKAFNKNAQENFGTYKESLNNGTTKVNASAVYPYDVLKTYTYGDKELSDNQWEALPNYLGDNFILPMIDVSGSMSTPVAGKTTAMDIAVSLGLYVASKQTGPFANISLTFSANPEIQKYGGNFSDMVPVAYSAEWGMNTNLQKAFEKVLDIAVSGKVSPSEMPKYLLILSDMEIDQATSNSYYSKNILPMDTIMEAAEKMFKTFGYELPKIVYWNLVSRNQHVPVTFDKNGTALISGFSPAIMKSVLKAENFNPVSIVLDTINNKRYDF